MLEYVKSAVTRNQSEKKINSLLDYIANSTNTKLLQSFYSTTLERLAEGKNERLWFKTQLKLCTLWFQMKEYSKAAKLMKELHRQASPSSASYDIATLHISLHLHTSKVPILTRPVKMG